MGQDHSLCRCMWCNHRPEVIFRNNSYRVYCDNCGAMVPSDTIEKVAKSEWERVSRLFSKMEIKSMSEDINPAAYQPSSI